MHEEGIDRLTYEMGNVTLQGAPASIQEGRLAGMLLRAIGRGDGHFAFSTHPRHRSRADGNGVAWGVRLLCLGFLVSMGLPAG